MNRNYLLLAAFIIAVGFAGSSSAASASTPPVVPQPKQWTSGSSTYRVITNPTFYISTRSIGVSTDLTNYFNWFLTFTFGRRAYAANATTGLGRILFNVTNSNPALQMGVDESYQLIINTSDIYINAPTTFGAYHAMQTLSQLITYDFDTHSYVIKNCPWNIVDSPRFQFRSILIDTARHFLPVQSVKNLIDSMAYAKFNTLHVHLVDGQSFPFDAPSNRNLAGKGAFSNQEIYTAQDMADMVEHGRQRAVRILIELDVPGHFGGWCYGEPYACLIPQCNTDQDDYPLAIAFENGYTAIQNVMNDLSSICPEAFFHLGGDQPVTTCWSNDPDVSSWLSSNGLSVNDGYRYAVERVQMMAESLGRAPIGWHEVWQYFGTDLTSDAVIQQRISTPSSSIVMNQEITSAGYRLIWGDTSRWYLDHLDVAWDTMYTAEPCDSLTSAQCKFVIGGEVCMWGETVDTSNLLQTIWPRAAAVAERLWSPESVTDTSDAENRISSFRCLLMQRGVQASPMFNGNARTAPTGPGSCLDQ